MLEPPTSQELPINGKLNHSTTETNNNNNNHLMDTLLPHMQNAWLRLQQQQLATIQSREESAQKVNEGEKVNATRKRPLSAEDDEMLVKEEGDDDISADQARNSESPARTQSNEHSPKSKRKDFQPTRAATAVEEAHEDPTAQDEAITEDSVETPNTEPSARSPTIPASVEESLVTQPTSLSSAMASSQHLHATVPVFNQANNANRIQELFVMQQKLYADWVEQQKKMFGTAGPMIGHHPLMAVNGAPPPTSAASSSTTRNTGADIQSKQRDLKALGQSLKQELISNFTSTIDKVLSDYAAAEAQAAQAASRAAAAQQQQQQQQQQQHLDQQRQLYLHQFAYHPYSPMGAFPATAGPNAAGIFPGAYGSPPTSGGATGTQAPGSWVMGMGGGQNRPTKDDLSLTFGMQRKKRSKVTDTRLSKMPVRAGSATPTRQTPTLSNGYCPPTMVGHPLYGSAASFGLSAGDRDDISPVISEDCSDSGTLDGNGMNQSSTLTPMHLRKAKLMFFYMRYPSSAVLKSYFPDIRFNKNNTAQLVKWFSNFREFYYIQMEKYARQALAEGCKFPEQIVVSLESEIYKQLNQHYNRNNHIQPPDKLRLVIQETLREFFLAIQSGKDAEPSWKKQIYKVIARMDDAIPEYFKDPHFLERLE